VTLSAHLDCTKCDALRRKADNTPVLTHMAQGREWIRDGRRTT
jgi:hypothetical protein